MTGVPTLDYYELPTKNTVLRRTALAPDEDDESVWFTEVAADRVGTIRFGRRVFTKREKEEDDDNEDGSRKKAETHTKVYIYNAPYRKEVTDCIPYSASEKYI